MDLSNVSAVARKRVLGVPVLYLVAAVVVVFAVYAFRMKPSTETATATESDDPAAPVQDTETYPELPSGTVYAPQTPTVTPEAADDANASIASNQEWLSRGTSYLVSQGVAGGVAQESLQKYLSGAQLSFVQAGHRDKVIAEYGIPPEAMTTGGTAPAAVDKYAALRTATDNAYRMSLGRDASDREEQYWIDQGATTKSIYGSVSGSAEAKDYLAKQTITGYYKTYLKRSPSANELSYWLAQSKTKGMPTVMGLIRDSKEAQSKR